MAEEEQAESSVKIIVTEDETENSNDLQEVGESPKEYQSEEAGTVVEETEELSDELDTLKPPELNPSRKSTLVEMDKKHAWLSELEEKYRNVEETFISKFQYVAVSNHCQKYLEELSSDDSVIKFRIEFSHLFDKFRTTFIGSQRLANKISEIKACKNIAEAENRKIKIQLEDRNQKIEKILVNQDSLQNNLLQMEKEKAAVQKLFSELSDRSTGDSFKEEVVESKPLVQDDEESQKKINELEERLESLDDELEFAKKRESNYKNRIQQVENIKSSLQKELNSVKYELQKQTTRAEKAEDTVLENNGELRNKNSTIKNMTEDLEQVKLNLEKTEGESRRLLKDLKKCQKTMDITTQAMEKFKRDVDLREDKIRLLVTQKDSLDIDLTNKQAEVKSLKGDVETITKAKNSLSRRVALLEERSTDAETKLETAKRENASQQKELDSTNRELEESDGKVRELTKQKSALIKEVLKHEQTISELQNEIKVSLEGCQNLEKELEKARIFANGLQDSIRRLERTKGHLAKEIVELNRNMLDLRGEIKRLQSNISELNKTEVKLRQQLEDERTKYKYLAEDERHYRKLLGESRHEVEQLRDQEVMLRKQIEQLQGYNQDLDERCKKLNYNIKKEKEQCGNMKESYKQEAKNCEELLAKLKRKDVLEQQLLKNLSNAENDVFALKRKMKNVVEEKNVQNSKLIEKDREIIGLKENIRLLEQEVITLDRSVNDRINDIKLLKIQITQINKSNVLMNEQVEFIDATRQELIDTQNKLMEEKITSKALESEIIKPMNLHRWRILEGIDPENSKLVAKNQSLQKQLIRRITELDAKDLELREKERRSKELHEQIRRRTETGIQEQLLDCKKELRARMERLKCLTGENNMFQNLCRKYEHEIEALKDRLRDAKVKEFNSKASKTKRTL